MALKIVAASVATASGIGLTWSDCGDAETIGEVTDLQPTTINLGKNQLKGTGVLSKDEDGGTFNFVAKAGPIPVLKGSGNLCEDTTIDMPLGAGSIVFHAIDCPKTAGDIEIDLDINVLSEEFTNDLIKVSLTAEGTSGDKLLCMDIGIQNAAEAKDPCLAVTGGCVCPENSSTDGQCTPVASAYACHGDDACAGSVDPSEANGLGCDVIGTVCNVVFSSVATSALGCTEDSALVVAACEAALLGPEDPLADTCAALLGGICEVSCIAAVAAGGSFSAHSCKKAAHCSGDVIV